MLELVGRHGNDAHAMGPATAGTREEALKEICNISFLSKMTRMRVEGVLMSIEVVQCLKK